jgi:hypothetical protein
MLSFIGLDLQNVTSILVSTKLIVKYLNSFASQRSELSRKTPCMCFWFANSHATRTKQKERKGVIDCSHGFLHVLAFGPVDVA